MFIAIYKYAPANQFNICQNFSYSRSHTVCRVNTTHFMDTCVIHMLVDLHFDSLHVQINTKLHSYVNGSKIKITYHKLNQAEVTTRLHKAFTNIYAIYLNLQTVVTRLNKAYNWLKTKQAQRCFSKCYLNNELKQNKKSKSNFGRGCVAEMF